MNHFRFLNLLHRHFHCELLFLKKLRSIESLNYAGLVALSKFWEEKQGDMRRKRYAVFQHIKQGTRENLGTSILDDKRKTTKPAE